MLQQKSVGGGVLGIVSLKSIDGPCPIIRNHQDGGMGTGYLGLGAICLSQTILNNVVNPLKIGGYTLNHPLRASFNSFVLS